MTARLIDWKAEAYREEDAIGDFNKAEDQAEFFPQCRRGISPEHRLQPRTRAMRKGRTALRVYSGITANVNMSLVINRL